MACGNNDPQQSTTATQDNSSPPMSMANGQPQMSMANQQPPMSMAPQGYTPPNAALFSNVAPAQMPTQAQMGGSPVNIQQMATAVASMPTYKNDDGTPVTDGMVNGKYNPQADQTIQQIAGRMQYLQNNMPQTPQQKFAQAHPIIHGIGAAMRGFGQGITKQPFATSTNENQTALENTQMQNASTQMSPANMLNMMYMKTMMPTFNGTGAGNMSGNKGNPLMDVAPHLAVPGAVNVVNGIPMVRDANGNWNPQGTK